MTPSLEERNRILSLVEARQITAGQAAQLLDALVTDDEPPVERAFNRTIRIWMSDLGSKQQKLKMTATLPAALVTTSLRLLPRLVPQLDNGTVRQLIQAIEGGATGRVLDYQDLEERKRIEIFIEQ
ncbi:MAG TPA: hypothetical protein VFA41_05725 [Ktedonobacteraceae bacterium]|jgi:hypothetical protein|nr:hypothetical protein [Ktedonobacteraceae bacterium]